MSEKDEKPRKPTDPKRDFKPARQTQGSPEHIRNFHEKKHPDDHMGEGLFGEVNYDEPKPVYKQVPSETVIDSKSNAQIVMGPYRPGGRYSKRMARGETGISTIDLVAGRLGSYAATVQERSPEQPVFADNNYKADAARLTICQKGDPDEDFGVRAGNVGTAVARSFVAAKADTVLLSGRESVKIVTGTDNENAQGGGIENPRGIDLIGGNVDTDMQPIPKGSNLVDCLDDVNDNIANLNGILLDFIMQQMIFNSVLAIHSHPVIGFYTTPSPEVVVAYTLQATGVFSMTVTSIFANRFNLIINWILYLNPKPGISDQYICSKYNSTN